MTKRNAPQPDAPSIGKNRKREFGPTDEWSDLSRLPRKTAEAVNLDRKIELYRALPQHSPFPDNEIASGVLSALDRMRDMNPQNAIESMLVSQVAAVHAQMLDCMRRANGVSDRFPQVQGAYLDRSARLGSLFLKQIDALDKRRGRGGQKVTVEHVHVNAGGNAIVGHVEASATASSNYRMGKETAKRGLSRSPEALD